MRVFDTVRELGSFRRAEDRPVSREKIGEILEAGRHAPSPGSVQSVEFVVVEDDESLRRLSSAVGDPRIEEVPTAVIVLGDVERMRREVVQSAERAVNAEAACAAQNMRLVAEENGVASCWITGFDSHGVTSAFSVPEGKRAEGVVGLCHTEDRIEPETRFGMNEVVFYDSYGNQLGSFFDEMEWEGVYEESEKLTKKIRGAYWKLRDRFTGVI